MNIFETSKSDKPEYFVDKVKDKRRSGTKGNNLEILIGWRGFPDPKDDTWEPLLHFKITYALTEPQAKYRGYGCAQVENNTTTE